MNIQNQFRSSPDPSYQESAIISNNSLLWKVNGKGLHNPSFIFGTMHLMCAEDALLSDVLKSVIEYADEIYFEMDLNDLYDTSGSQLGYMHADTLLKSLYTEQEYARIMDFFEKHNMSSQFESVQNMQPLLITSLIYQTVLPCEQSDGMELVIMKYAQLFDKKLNGLETAAFQAALLDQIPYAVQAKELLRGIDTVESFQQHIEQITNLYKKQDITGLLELACKTEYNDQMVLDILLHNRNKNWAQQFEDISAGKKLLIAVGAGHLAGSEWDTEFIDSERIYFNAGFVSALKGNKYSNSHFPLG